MSNNKYKYVIIGSGAGGGTLARELSKRGEKVLVVERGRLEKKVGTFLSQLRYFDYTDRLRLPRKSKEGVVLFRTLMLGGTTVVSAGNMRRSLQKELADLGIVLEEEYLEAEKELHIAPIDRGLLSEGSEAILKAARDLGYKMDLMPKSIDPVKCRKCGNCNFGCVYGAKWSSLNYLREARRSGTAVLCDTNIKEVIIENGKAKGVRGIGPDGPIEIQADFVILAAGALGTPVILQESGIKNAGTGLFADLTVAVSGVTDGLNQLKEPATPIDDQEFYENKGIVLMAHVFSNRIVRFVLMGPKAFVQPPQRLIGIIAMIRDEPVGRIFPDGTVSKPVTDNDRIKLSEGTSIAKEILIKSGADERSIEYSVPLGLHPGGTAAIDKLVDKDLRTEAENLFVCDASVLPATTGKCQILTIIALAKRLAKTLI